MAAVLAFVSRRRWWFLAALAGALALGSYLGYRQIQASQQRAAALASLRTEVIGRGDIVSAVGATGSILPEQQSNLFFGVPGTAVEVLAQSGDTVQAGQLLARVEDADLRLAVQQAEDALAVAQLTRQKLLAGASKNDLAAATANVLSANAALNDALAGASAEQVAIAQLKYDDVQDQAQKAYEQYYYLVQLGKDYPQFAPSGEALEAARNAADNAGYSAEIARLQVEQLQNGGGPPAVAVARARLAQAQAALKQLQAPPGDLQKQQADLAVEQAQTALDAAQLRLERSRLTAPYAGVIATVNVKVGEPAGAAPAVVLLDPSQFHLEVNVDEVDIAQLEAGQLVTVTLDALPGVELTGRVDRLAPVASSVGGIVSYAVRLTLDPTDASLRAGMSATANIAVAEAHGVLLVPNWAIRRDRRTGQAYASLKVGETLQEVPIQTGLRGDTYTEVTSGVQEGDVAAVSTSREQISFFGGQ